MMEKSGKTRNSSVKNVLLEEQRTSNGQQKNNKRHPQNTITEPQNATKTETNQNYDEDTNIINILLLGMTGIGKSTFINSFVNYLTHVDFESALVGELTVLIPTKFSVTDRFGESHTIKVGKENKNERLVTGESQTQNVFTYVFPILDGFVKIRLIDTPGMGDTNGGIEKDNENCEEILNYVGNLKILHAICFLLRAQESKDHVLFKYCMNQIFSRLDRSACDNIIFCFTHTRGSDYNAGESMGTLRKNIVEIRSRPPYANIPLDRNVFCFDNECFRYLAAIKEGVQFESNIHDRNMESWQKSSERCWTLYHYITGDKYFPPITPHNVQSTNAINEARRMINKLARPMADISEDIQRNVHLLERHSVTLNEEGASLEEMKKRLYVPLTVLEVEHLEEPATVCTDLKCAELIKVGDTTAFHYKTRCHDPCYLEGVPKEIIGAPKLIDCAAMTNSICHCNCNFKVHMHVYYLTKPIESQTTNENVLRNITNATQLIEETKKIKADITTKKLELEMEHKILVAYSAEFAHFLQKNAITPFNDTYKEYIEYLVDREKRLGQYSNPKTIKRLVDLLAEYVEKKTQLEQASQNEEAPSTITPRMINDRVKTLFALKHSGPKIKELHDCQDKPSKQEHEKKEYRHIWSLNPFRSKIGFGTEIGYQGLAKKVLGSTVYAINASLGACRLLVTKVFSGGSRNQGMNSNLQNGQPQYDQQRNPQYYQQEYPQPHQQENQQYHQQGAPQYYQFGNATPMFQYDPSPPYSSAGAGPYYSPNEYQEQEYYPQRGSQPPPPQNFSRTSGNSRNVSININSSRHQNTASHSRPPHKGSTRHSPPPTYDQQGFNNHNARPYGIQDNGNGRPKVKNSRRRANVNTSNRRSPQRQYSDSSDGEYLDAHQ